MSLGQDEVLTCLSVENLAENKHHPSEPTTFTNVQDEDGDSRDSGIVSDYSSPIKMASTPIKATTRKAFTDKTNIDGQTQDTLVQSSFFSRSARLAIEESPISSRRPPQQTLILSPLRSGNDDENGSMLSASNVGDTSCNIMRTCSSASVSSFSCAESDIIWTPPKTKHICTHFNTDERRAVRLKFRKRSTECLLSDSGIVRKRSCAMRAHSEISFTEEEVFEADDFSPNASQQSMTSSTTSSLSFSPNITRAQSTGQLEMGNHQQKSPLFTEVEYSLPGVERPQQESLAFRSISAETLANEIRRLGPEEFERRYTLIDCRYPYEFEGGHVKCAMNVHDQNELERLFFPDDPNHPIRKRIPIFYCEFSQKRGPGMAMALRSIDRMRNEFNYPKVDYAEMYLLDLGYRKFWNDGCYKSECDPCGYVPMTDSAHVSSLIKYKWHKSKSTSTLVVRDKEKMSQRRAFLYRHRSLMQVCTEVESTEVVVSPTAKTPQVVPCRLEFTDSPECSSAE